MKTKRLQRILEEKQVKVSAPCRIDLGGTLDIRTFHLPLRHLAPCTFNIAIDMLTHVKLLPYQDGIVRISSTGFQSAQFHIDEVPFDHPMGLMFAIAAYFRAEGVHIHIDSSSPPRSALGGSSAAAVALVAAFSHALADDGQNELSASDIAILAHAIEESVAGVPCGFQDQLAAVFGGVNAWYWPCQISHHPFRKKRIIPEEQHADLEKHFILAYCGMPHESANINGKWVRQFLSGRFRQEWRNIISCTKKFIDSLGEHNYKDASESMRQETSIRMQMTPDVLDVIGKKLIFAADENQCGARFTGAGGGGCIWALGNSKDIERLKPVWQKILQEREGACLLDTKINASGLVVV